MSTTAQIIPERLDALTRGKVYLDNGSHHSFGDGHCAMEVVSWLAGLGHTDAPECASPVLRDFTINLNDTWGPVQRQKLVPFLPRMVGTANDGQDEARSYLALDWLIRTHTPAWLELAGLTEDAQNLRGLPEIVDLVTAEQAGAVVRTAYEHADAAWDAARATAWAAPRAASGDAAGDAAWDAAWHARATAGNAARYAARAAASVAGVAAPDSLQPTVTTLQASALELLDRMINPSAVAA